MDQLPVGTVQTMQVKRVIDTGYVLDKDGVEVLLHTNEATETLTDQAEINVFLYHDKQMNIIATMILPSITIDQYNWAEVMEVIPDLGVFVNIGTTKEILVSIDDLPVVTEVWPKQGDQLYVTLGKDRQGRLLALPATEGVVESEREWAPENLLNTTLEGRVYFTSREGTALLTEEGYRGFIHHTERQAEPRLGEQVKGRVIDVKEDGTLNISLLPLKQHRMDDDAETILQALQENEGTIPFSDKSDPEDIRGTYHMSKSAFKRALGQLMKQDLVEQRDGQTFLKK